MPLKKYRPWNPDQVFLFPPAMRDWLEEDHLVYRLLDVVDALDIRSVSHSIHAVDAQGTRPYNPRMMLALPENGYPTRMSFETTANLAL